MLGVSIILFTVFTAHDWQALLLMHGLYLRLHFASAAYGASAIEPHSHAVVSLRES